MEDLIYKLGGFGRYQVFLMFFVFLTTFSIATNYYTQLFSLLEPSKTCIEESRDGCTIIGSDKNISECLDWNYDYLNQFPTLVSEANWVCEKDALPKIISTVFWIGNAIGSVLFGISNDLLGRKKTIFISHFIYLVGTGMSLFFTRVFEYQVISRLFIGISHHTVSHLPYLLAVEFCTKETRPIALLVMMSSYTLSSVLIPILSAFYIQHWTHLVYISIALISLSLALVPFIPESLSWLACIGNKEEFGKVFRRIRSVNGYNRSELDDSEKVILELFKPIKKAKKKVRSLIDLSMFRRLCLNCVIIILVCCSCFMCYYGHVQNTANLGSNIYFNFIYGSLFEIGAWCTPFIINKCGRRYVIAMLLLFSGISSIAYGFVPTEFGNYKISIALAGRIFITGAYYISLLYASEIFPTEIRGKGMAICEFVGGFGIILSPSIVYLSKYSNSIPMLIFGTISVMAGLVSCCLPETANQSLSQTMEDGNEFGKKQRIFPCISLKESKNDPFTKL